MRPLLRNATANYVGGFFAVIIPVLLLPAYVKLLDDLHWGLVSFVATVQSLLVVLDAGFGQVLVREFVVRRTGSHENAGAHAKLLHACEPLYWIVGALVGVSLAAFSAPIAHGWLELPDAALALGRYAILGAALICAVQFPGLLYRCAVVSSEQHVPLNVLIVSGIALRFGGGLFVVWLWPSVLAYLSWQFVILLLETFARRAVAWRLFGGQPRDLAWRFSELRSIGRSMAILAIAAIIGGLTTQADKVILSSTRPIAELGHYFIASQLALGTLQLLYPLTNTVLPRVIQLRDDSYRLFGMNVRLLLLILGLSGACAGAFALIGPELIALWLGDAHLAATLLPVIKMLLIAVLFNAICNVGYMTWLARNQTVRILLANSTALLTIIVVTPFAVEEHGLIGASTTVAAASLLVAMWSLEWMFHAKRTH